MDLNRSLDPAFLADLDGVPAQEVVPHIEAAARTADLPALENLTCALLDRVLRVLRDGSRREILDEALVVSSGLSGEPGKLLRKRYPEVYASWTTLDDLLAEAGRRHDRAAVPGILKSTQGLGLRVLEILAKEGGAAPRSRIRETLDLTESHLSHLLYNLEEADLVVRFRQGKEVHVELGPVGQDLVKTTVFPAWVESFLAAMERTHQGEQIEDALVDELVRAGAPSRLVAEKLSECLGRGAMRFAELTLLILRQLGGQRAESARIANRECAATVPSFQLRSQQSWAAM